MRQDGLRGRSRAAGAGIHLPDLDPCRRGLQQVDASEGRAGSSDRLQLRSRHAEPATGTAAGTHREQGLRPTTSFTYTTKGQLDTQTDAEGRVTKVTYSPTTGEALSITRNFGGLALLESKTYTPRGDIATATDARGFTSIFSYDAERHLVTTPAPLRARAERT